MGRVGIPIMGYNFSVAGVWGHERGLHEPPRLLLDREVRGARHHAAARAGRLARAVVEARRDPVTARVVDTILSRFGIEIEAFTREHAELARAAYRDFGRGSGHRARLNFGDCISYALATATGEPLLYKGDDFGHTDIRSALE